MATFCFLGGPIIDMSGLFLFSTSVKRDPNVELWIERQPENLRQVARRWFDVMRACGDDVRELLHDGHPTACVGKAAFGYVNAFTGHVNVGFFRGSEIDDPLGMLIGNGKRMRHVKLQPERDVDAKALTTLIKTAYLDMKQRMAKADNANRS